MAIILPSDIKHVIIEVVTESSNILFNPELARELAIKIARILKSEILEEAYKKFENGAYTYLAVLSTSHIVINTYPEKGYLDIDLAWCSNVEFEEDLFKEFVEKNLNPQKYYLIQINRKLAKEI